MAGCPQWKPRRVRTIQCRLEGSLDRQALKRSRSGDGDVQVVVPGAADPRPGRCPEGCLPPGGSAPGACPGRVRRAEAGAAPWRGSGRSAGWVCPCGWGVLGEGNGPEPPRLGWRLAGYWCRSALPPWRQARRLHGARLSTDPSPSMEEGLVFCQERVTSPPSVPACLQSRSSSAMRREAWPSTGPMSSAVVRARASARRSGRSPRARPGPAPSDGPRGPRRPRTCRIVRSMHAGVKRKRRAPVGPAQLEEVEPDHRPVQGRELRRGPKRPR